MSDIKPLRARVMTLDELQRKALKLLKQTRKQLMKKPYEEGPTDMEFIEHLRDFEHQIRNDREMIQILKVQERKDAT